MAAITASLAVAAGSAYMAKKSADKQTDALRQGQDTATAEQRRQYDLSRADFAPWREAGVNALGQLEDPVENFYASPDYEFRRSEGLRDTGNMFNMKGGGGNAMKGVTGFASNLASGEFGNWFDRTFAQSEAGRGATGTTAHLGANAANNIGGYAMNTGMNIAGAQGQKYENINNALVGGVGNLYYAGKDKGWWGKKPAGSGGK